MTTLSLRAVIAQVESGGRANALRLERGVLNHTALNAPPSDRIRAIHKCSEDTALMIYSTSWGKYQIMGFNLYAPGVCNYPFTIFDFIAANQDNCFDLFLQANNLEAYTMSMLLNDEAARRAFITRYNGPGNVDGYWEAMEKAYVGLGGTLP